MKYFLEQRRLWESNIPSKDKELNEVIKYSVT